MEMQNQFKIFGKFKNTLDKMKCGWYKYCIK